MLVRAIPLCVAISLVACADDPTTIVELTVTETIPVDFGAMSGGVSESAAVTLADLRDESAYADNLAALRCSGLDLDGSGITVTQLSVGAGATVLTYSVEVSAAGPASWTQLATFNGSVISGQSVALSDPRFTVDPTGMGVLQGIILSPTPTLAVQVRAQVPGDLDAMQVALKLVQVFSSETNGCPTLATGS
ncbi:MAG: hypothetical protein CVU56_03995 [Deltaproteobacteria bacterium HGW-Deltaproteobacteria-14]|jgi:hypothetical protein|nr:MAG: hypothetical protein CVU56_03995 [Deltaproteobacteria bacterium HGW-Deltaproteobacteria-14]